MSKTFNIKGRVFSEDTIVEALKKHTDFEETPVVKHGDILEDSCKTRLVVIKNRASSIWPGFKNGFVAFYDNGTPNNPEDLIRLCNYKIVGNVFER